MKSKAEELKTAQKNQFFILFSIFFLKKNLRKILITLFFFNSVLKTKTDFGSYPAKYKKNQATGKHKTIVKRKNIFLCRNQKSIM